VLAVGGPMLPMKNLNPGHSFTRINSSLRPALIVSRIFLFFARQLISHQHLTALLEVRDRWFRVLVVLLPLGALVFARNVTSNPTVTKIVQLFISLVALIAITEGSRFLVYNSRKWYRGRKRLLFVLLAGIIWTMLFLTLSVVFREMTVKGLSYEPSLIDSNVTINNYKVMNSLVAYALVNSIFTFPLLFIIYETFYRYALLRNTQLEKDKLEKEKLRAELQQLKGIVNPHFLFNNLNSLSSLIIEDPVQAQEFLDELTKVFRYLLKNNEADLTTLAEELKFIHSYYHLLQTRYGKSIQLDIDIPESYLSLELPPLTLQLLVENAVKHNRLQKDNPLHIELVVNVNKQLIVRNNICRKEGHVDSTGIGLQNINARYRMLGEPELQVIQTEKQFSAIISLIDLSLHLK
jgi:two-component system, LytTR family, sensor kinase